MALTTYVKGRAYDWSHAIGRAAANGTGFNYPQTMCLGNDGDIFVANRGNENTFAMRVNRVKIGGPGEEECIFDAEGTPLTHLVGDAQVMSKWGQQSIDANPDMMKAYRRARNLEPLWRFCFPTAVDFDPKTDRIIVADSQRNRLQIYRKVSDYVDFQANL